MPSKSLPRPSDDARQYAACARRALAIRSAVVPQARFGLVTVSRAVVLATSDVLGHLQASPGDFQHHRPFSRIAGCFCGGHAIHGPLSILITRWHGVPPLSVQGQRAEGGGVRVTMLGPTNLISGETSVGPRTDDRPPVCPSGRTHFSPGQLRAAAPVRDSCQTVAGRAIRDRERRAQISY